MSNYQLFNNDLPNKFLKSFKGDISIDTETLGLNIKRDRPTPKSEKINMNSGDSWVTWSSLYPAQTKKMIISAI